MTLNASGPISLGGSAAGQSVNLELGQSATATISMNDANVRALAGVSSGAISLPGNFYGKSNTPSFSNFLYANYGSSYDPIACASPSINSSGQIFAATRVYYNGGLPQGIGVQKINNDGSTAWANIYYSSGGNNLLPDVSRLGVTKFALDSSSNIYIIGYYGFNTVVVKIDTNGNIIWGRGIDFGGPTKYLQYVIGSVIDSAGNLVCAFLYVDSSSGPAVYITAVVKFDTNGTVLWQKDLGATGAGRRLFALNGCLAVDSSNNIYVGGRSTDVFNQLAPAATKLDSNGTFQWFSVYTTGTTSGASGEGQHLTVSNGGDLYLAGWYNNATSYKDAVVLRLDKSNGAVLSQASMRIASSANSKGYISLAADSSNNVYGLSVDYLYGGIGGPVIIKYNSTLSSISWQQVWSASASGQVNGYGIAINNTNYVTSGPAYTPVPTPTATGNAVFSLPNSGSVTGTLTYNTSPTGTVSIASSSYTSPGLTLNQTSGTFAANTTSFTIASYGVTSSALSSYSNTVRTQP